MNPSQTNWLRKLFNWRLWAAGLFWSWNIIFVAFMLFGFAPRLVPEMIEAVRANVIPQAVLLNALVLTLIPVVVLIIGFFRLRRAPDRLFMLGYGVEGPLLLLLALRFFLVREANPAVTVLLLTAGLGMICLLWSLLDARLDQRGPRLLALRVFGLTLLLAVGLYASLWLAFYAVPVGAEGSKAVGRILGDLPEFWRGLTEGITRLLTEELRWLPFYVLGMSLSLYSATLFVLMPLAVPLLYIRAWRHSVRKLVEWSGWPQTAALIAAGLAICVVPFILAARQPQHLAFALLETPPQTRAEAQALLDRQAAIRAGLLNAFLAPQRYLGAVGEVDHVSDIYRQSLNLPDVQAEQVQKLYETVARPVLYRPVHPATASGQALLTEPGEAARLYEQFFDQPIIDAERETVLQAARSTWQIEQAQAAWQAIDDREILLTQQEIKVQTHGDWADIELYEVYQNQTGQRQEVVYYFSLPESAVITGLWLGNSADREERFAFRVSPRGAAQTLYRNEVRRNIDPALVEQIGPRQYRLRIFPVEPQISRWDDTRDRNLTRPGPPLHMWLTYRALADEGRWPLPRLAERLNVYWDEQTNRRINGETVAVEDEAWLPADLPAEAATAPIVHRVDFPGGESVVARPISADEPAPLPDALNLAVVLDRSRSMADRDAEVGTALTELKALTTAGTTADVYLTASVYRGEAPTRVQLADLDPATLLYYGGQNAAELLAQFDQLAGDQRYDAVLVLTDGSGYELSSDVTDLTLPAAPVWLVHLGGDFPLGYDDATLEAIQASGGGVAGSVIEALTRLTAARTQTQSRTTDVIDGYVWLTVPTEVAMAEAGETVVHAPGDPFAAFAARRLILADMQRAALGRVETLDQLHAVALEHSIVTPYSSMIVLVTPQQQQLLNKLEQRGDRFEREYEAIGETEADNPFAVTGVPEPEEWLLLALTAALLVWYLRRGTHKPARNLSH